MCPEVVCPENKQEAKTKSLAIFAVGSMVATAYHVRNAVEKETGYGPELINMRFIKPLDLEKFDRSSQSMMWWLWWKKLLKVVL